MEDLQKRHRLEQKDLQARITQKKKSTTKKTRKRINDECAELERQLTEKQAHEISEVNGTEDSNISLARVDEYQGHEDENGSTKTNPEQIADPTIAPPAPGDKHTKKPNRHKARLARRAAELESIEAQATKDAETMPDLRKREHEAMRAQLISKNLREQEIRSDGHCLYAAVADQLMSRGLGLEPKVHLKGINNDNNGEVSIAGHIFTRRITAFYIEENADDFLPFLEEPLVEYLRKIQDTGEWGGHLELLALAKSYEVDINVLHSSGHIDRIESGAERKNSVLWLSYYRHSFGLGEHYNSLRQGT